MFGILLSRMMKVTVNRCTPFFALRRNNLIRFSIMANRSGLLEKESVAFAPIAKPPEMDDLLENTLLNIKIDKSLTKREAEILNLIVAGKTNKEISLKIFRTERTVEYHRHRLMRKLGTKTAADLVKRAIVMGIT